MLIALIPWPTSIYDYCWATQMLAAAAHVRALMAG